MAFYLHYPWVGEKGSGSRTRRKILAEYKAVLKCRTLDQPQPFA